ERDKLAAFVAAARGRGGGFSCSLHLEYVEDIDGLCDKAAWLAAELSVHHDPALPPPHLCVTSVATRAALPRLPELAATFAAAGVVFKVQPEKQDGDAIAYDDDETEALLALGGHNRTGVVLNSFTGAPCWAGARYFILDDLGRAWRCYPARRARRERLGDFLDPGFRLFDDAEPRPCLYERSDCTVPMARGMMYRKETT